MKDPSKGRAYMSMNKDLFFYGFISKETVLNNDLKNGKMLLSSIWSYPKQMCFHSFFFLFA